MEKDGSRGGRLIDLGHLRYLTRSRHLFESEHSDYLWTMKNKGTEPSVIYDIGSNVLHWTHAAREVWPNARFFAFEAMSEVAPIYEEENIPFHLSPLSNRDGREVKFYVSPQHPGGNSYYKENSEVRAGADEDFLEEDARLLKAMTLDTVVEQRGWPLPDLIKIDVQGAEMDVLQGSKMCLRDCRDLILELQTVEYNRGAPSRSEVTFFVETLGFTLQYGPFIEGGPDGDYHFVKRP